MPRQPWLLDILSDEFRGSKGFRVDFYPGWELRGRTSFAPLGVMDHHTGGGSYNNLLRYMAEGPRFPPLCNYATSRPSSGVVRITVVAAGRANHAGRGNYFFTGLNNGNTRTIGAEHQNDGGQSWPSQQIEAMRRCDAALLKYLGKSTSYMLDHKTYAPSRKVDRHSLSISSERSAVNKILSGVTYITTGDYGPDVKSWQQSLMKWNSNALPEYGDDSDFGGETVKWTLKFFDEYRLSALDRNRPRVGAVARKTMADVLDNPWWKDFMMSLSKTEQSVLESFAKTLANYPAGGGNSEGVAGSSFANAMMSFHRGSRSDIERMVDGMRSMNTNPRTLGAVLVAMIREARARGWEIDLDAFRENVHYRFNDAGELESSTDRENWSRVVQD